MQLRLCSKLTLETYLSQQAWLSATLQSCPLHPGRDCGLARHGSYLRKHPQPIPIARWYCRAGHTTFSLLPDFLSSRLPGTLAEVELVAAAAEGPGPVDSVCYELRAGAVEHEVSWQAAKRWAARRRVMFVITLTAVVGIFADRLAEVRTAAELRARLGAEPALVALREIVAPHLGSLPPPLGFGPRLKASAEQRRRLQHNTGPAP